MNVRLPKNGAGNMQDMLKQAQKLQEDMANLEKELEGYSEYKTRVKYRLIPFIW